METSNPRKVQRTRKLCICDWCGERIEPGTPSVSWFTFGEGSSARMHPECYNAQSLADLYDEELPPAGTYRRGCWCGETEEHCKCVKENA